MEVEIALLQSIDKRLAKLQILDVMREELGKLRASQEYSQMQIDDLMSENVVLKCSIQTVENKVAAIEKENKQLRETLLDFQCRSMRDNIVLNPGGH